MSIRSLNQSCAIWCVSLAPTNPTQPCSIYVKPGYVGSTGLFENFDLNVIWSVVTLSSASTLGKAVYATLHLDPESCHTRRPDNNLQSEMSINWTEGCSFHICMRTTREPAARFMIGKDKCMGKYLPLMSTARKPASLMSWSQLINDQFLYRDILIFDDIYVY